MADVGYGWHGYEGRPGTSPSYQEILSTSNQVTCAPQLVSKSLGFLSVVVKMGSHRSLFEAQSTLENFVDRIILPNMVMRSKSSSSLQAETID
jgi:exportin-2 (importin alpha re-exporter)